ncbi:DUF6334 family protein [Streptomyces sp. NPDC059443]|uniref:DUF6334 family protein n=1 Tax=unclassified Streptomyces TaxID=2593676 RepID=UPI0036770A21
MFQEERRAMCYRAGRLLGVRYGSFPDTPTMIPAVILDFEDGSWVLAVNADDDTIRISRSDGLPLEGMRIAEAPEESPWTRALSASAQWIWTLENQQGYEDGVQFSFSREGTEVCRIQLIAVASGWHII